MIDLHIHSTYSDGTSSIEEIIELAKKLNLTQIAITDHNILQGSIEANKISSIDFVVGTELSVDHKGEEVHLLAYFPNQSDYKHTTFIINEGEAYKRIALMEMIENLNSMGIDIDIKEVSSHAKGIINRVHICETLMDKGIIASIDEGFKKYVGENCDAYVQRKTISLFEAIEAIHQDGGLAIIAHPYEYTKKFESIDEFLNEIINHIDGIECFHPSATSKNSEHLCMIANSYNKIITGGSDYHGKNKPNINLGMMNVSDLYAIKK